METLTIKDQPTPPTPEIIQQEENTYPGHNQGLFIRLGCVVNHHPEIETSNEQYKNPLNKVGQDLLRKAQEKRLRKGIQKGLEKRTILKRTMLKHNLGDSDIKNDF